MLDMKALPVELQAAAVARVLDEERLKPSADAFDRYRVSEGKCFRTNGRTRIVATGVEREEGG